MFPARAQLEPEAEGRIEEPDLFKFLSCDVLRSNWHVH